MNRLIIGVDPGVTCGITWAVTSGWGTLVAVRAASCDYNAYREILIWRLEEAEANGFPVLIAAEKFVTGNKAGSKGKNADVTRAGVELARLTAEPHGWVEFVTYPAAMVKPWATDKRLAQINFPLAPKMKDARDSGRHMLYAAVKAGYAKDPLI